MIEKLRIHSSEEIKEKLSRTVFGDLLETKYISSQPPTNEELMAKINEIIDFINNKEDGQWKRL